MFQHDKRGETWLNGLGVQVTYSESLAISRLDPNWKIHNAGRPDSEPKVERAVLGYAELMEKGSPAPAIIVYLGANGYEVLDGIQRTHAAQLAGFGSVAAFIVDCDERTARKIRTAANIALTTQAPVDEDWCLNKLVTDWMINGSDTARDIATLCGRRIADVERIHQRAITRSRIESACGGKDGQKPLKPGLLDAIAKVADPTDFELAAKPVSSFVGLLNKCAFKNGDSVRMINDFFGISRTGGKNRETQLRSKLRVIQQDPIVKSRLSGPKKRTGVDKIDSAFKALHTVVKEHKAEAAPLDEKELITSWHNTYLEVGRLLRQQTTTQLRRDLEPFETSTRQIKS